MGPEQMVRKLETAKASLSTVYDLAPQEQAFEKLLARANTGDGNIRLYEKLGRLQSEIQRYKELATSVSFAQDYLKLAIEIKDEDTLPSATVEAEEVLNKARSFVVARKFTGAHDESPAVLTFRAGVGGSSLEPYLYAFAGAYARFSHRQGLSAQEIERLDDTELELRVSGRHAYAWLRSEDGLHRIIYEAPNGSRQTGYVSVTVEPVIPSSKVKVVDSDIRAEFIGGSTPGGQHANKTATGVRLTHIPTGITATSRMRSQAQNIKAAREVLASRVELHYEQAHTCDEARRPLGRGHHFRSYGLAGAKFISDQRSGAKMEDPTSFFQGYIEPFVFGFHNVEFF